LVSDSTLDESLGDDAVGSDTRDGGRRASRSVDVFRDDSRRRGRGAEQIWPWLVQIGYQRGGLYSYDWLDRLFGYLDRPSATSILPEFQHLAVGDRIPVGRGPSWPVAVVETNRALVLDMRNLGGGFDWVWQFGLYPVDQNRTRLVSRSRVCTKTIWARLATYAIEPAGFVMTRRMLLGLKQRAEALGEANSGESGANQRPAA
jgi:hypothetical protein